MTDPRRDDCCATADPLSSDLARQVLGTCPKDGAERADPQKWPVTIGMTTSATAANPAISK